jgi:hypothetical protein
MTLFCQGRAPTEACGTVPRDHEAVQHIRTHKGQPDRVRWINHYLMLTGETRDMGKGKPAQVPRKDERVPVFSVTLKDCEVQHFRAGGPGGQKQNKTSSGTRVIHHPSGARGESREERSQPQNTRAAFRRMVQSPKFGIWVNRTLWGNPEPPEERVEKDMDPSNLLIMAREDGRWRIID